jgi:AcrR family transcriptional regulator
LRKFRSIAAAALAHIPDGRSSRVTAASSTGASLYNAFGDKRALYRKALDHYIEGSIADRMRRCEKLAPREAISAFLAEIVKRSLEDRQPRFAAAMTVLGSMVQTNGFGLTL